jgi:hypothetical protein
MIVLFVGTLLAPAALAAESAGVADRAGAKVGADRLFLSFAEDAAFADKQWWEGQVEFADGDPVDVTLARFVVALQPVRALEVGGRIGFGSTSGPSGFPDGTGATDLDVWGKWNFGTFGGDTSFAAGALGTIPTGDDTSGLGTDAFDLELFGSLRHRLPGMEFSGHAGYRLNGDGKFGGVELNGKSSAIFGAAILIPIRDRLSVVGEANVETERFHGADADTRVLGGVNWTPSEHGVVRGALAFGLTNGAPNVELLLGYARLF